VEAWIGASLCQEKCLEAFLDHLLAQETDLREVLFAKFQCGKCKIVFGQLRISSPSLQINSSGFQIRSQAVQTSSRASQMRFPALYGSTTDARVRRVL